jgi:hypothetical protein
MPAGEIRDQIDRVWDAFRSAGIANPVKVIEQFAYLLFFKRLDLESYLHEENDDLAIE